MSEERKASPDQPGRQRPVSFAKQAVNLLELEDGWGADEPPLIEAPLAIPPEPEALVAAAAISASFVDPAAPPSEQPIEELRVEFQIEEDDAPIGAPGVIPALGLAVDVDVDQGVPEDDPFSRPTPPAGMDVVTAYAAAFDDDDEDSGADAMGLVDARHSHPLDGNIAGLMRRAADQFSLGDFTGSLAIVERVLQSDPGHREAREYREKNRNTLLSMYESKIGALSQVPMVAIPQGEIVWLNLDHRAGFVLSQIDGEMSFEDVLDLCAMPRVEVCRIFAELLAENVIRVKPAPGKSSRHR